MYDNMITVQNKIGIYIFLKNRSQINFKFNKVKIKSVSINSYSTIKITNRIVILIKYNLACDGSV